MTRKPIETKAVSNVWPGVEVIFQQESYIAIERIEAHRIFYPCGKINHFTHDNTDKQKTSLANPPPEKKPCSDCNFRLHEINFYFGLYFFLFGSAQVCEYESKLIRNNSS